MIDRWVPASSAYLASAKARESLERDPYWPKWDSPWWHVTLLHELDRADAVPRDAAQALLAALDAKYLRFFPTGRDPLPKGKDAQRDAACHCALGNVYRALKACGADVDARAPWIRAWLLRYQLPDGGLNCDDRAYAEGGAGSSSIQSTLPALEAILDSELPYTPAEEDFLDRGADYLIKRRLARRRRDGKVMDPDFLKICFPRFYDYDVLRGLAFLAEWSRARRKAVPREAVAGTMAELEARFPDGVIRVERGGLAAEGSLNPSAGGAWARGSASTFPLLDAARRAGQPSPALTRRWALVRETLR